MRPTLFQPLWDKAGFALGAITAAIGPNAAMACTAGSMVFSYFNDSYFWVVTRFAGLDGIAALKGWSGITTAVWAGSIPLLFIANAVLG